MQKMRGVPLVKNCDSVRVKKHQTFTTNDTKPSTKHETNDMKPTTNVYIWRYEDEYKFV
jgi:hypothetical protein